MKCIIVAFTIAIWTSSAAAQNLDSVVLQLLLESKSAKTSQDLADLDLVEGKGLDSIALWTSAISIATDSIGGEASGRAAISRLMEAALLVGGVLPDTHSLDRLTSQDIEAMRDAIGFPDRSDLLLYLLKRNPSLRDSFQFETYTAIRLAPKNEMFRQVYERTDIPYLGLGPTFSSKSLKPQDDPVSRVEGEFAFLQD